VRQFGLIDITTHQGKQVFIR